MIENYLPNIKPSFIKSNTSINLRSFKSIPAAEIHNLRDEVDQKAEPL